MKKNKMMRLASVLVVAVLLTTSIISGTFAKYVTTDSIEDQARVAKFGVTVVASGSLFDETYLKADDNTPGNSDGEAPDYDPDDIFSLTVESSNGNKLVAPGTENLNGITVNVTGAPETDVKVIIEFTAISEVFLAANEALPDMTNANGDTFENAADYYPIAYILGGTLIDKLFTDDEGNLDFVKFQEMLNIGVNEDGENEKVVMYTTDAGYFIGGGIEVINRVIAKIYGDNDALYVDANTNLAEAVGTLTLGWQWDFDDHGKGTYDKQDTLLGDLASAKYGDFDAEGELFGDLVDGEDYCLEVSVKLTVTVVQVD